MEKKEKSLAKQPTSSAFNQISDYITRSINEADMEAAFNRVAGMRENFPDDSSEELADRLIRNKCLQTGAVGAVTSAASMIPGLGTFAALTFGVAADIGMTFKLQSEMVLEVAAAYQQELDDEEKKRVILVVTGVSVGVNQAAQVAGKRIAQKATEKLAEKSVLKAIPFVGVGASAGVNITSTYMIGQRAKSYFSLSPAERADWSESARAISGIDERAITDWLVETTERSWELFSSSAGNAAGAVIVAGKSTGEVVAINAKKVSEAVNSGYQGTIQGISSTTGKMVATGKWAGANVVATANAASKTTVDTGKWLAEGVASGAIAAGGVVTAGARKTSEMAVITRDQVIKGIGAAAEVATQAGKKTSESAAAAVNKTGQIAAQAGRDVAKGAGALTDSVASAGKTAGEGMVSTAKKASEMTSQAGRGIANRASSASNAVSKIFKRVKRDNLPKQTPDEKEADEPTEQTGGQGND